MTDMEKKIAFLLSASPYLDVLGHTYDDAAKDLAANGVTVQKWIPVTERLPEYDKKVLVTDVRDDYTSISELKSGGKCLVDCWDCEDTLRLPVSEITHWMPLPQPPKEGE